MRASSRGNSQTPRRRPLSQADPDRRVKRVLRYVRRGDDVDVESVLVRRKRRRDEEDDGDDRWFARKAARRAEAQRLHELRRRHDTGAPEPAPSEE